MLCCVVSCSVVLCCCTLCFVGLGCAVACCVVSWCSVVFGSVMALAFGVRVEVGVRVRLASCCMVLSCDVL